ncbi:MAG: hypothetical protein ACFFD5_13330 [Candidatus Thorarchaeota archaeon]
MESKGLGLFLILLGGIFLGIALITIWSVFLTWDELKGTYIILAIPLTVFGFSTIFFGFYLMYGQRLGPKVKGLILIVNGIVPILGSVLTILDDRLLAFDMVRITVLLPLILVGIFLIIYGLFLMSADWYIRNTSTRKKANQILGLICSSIGVVNIVFFILLLISEIHHPLFFSIMWLILGVVLIIFGINLIIKKLEQK